MSVTLAFARGQIDRLGPYREGIDARDFLGQGGVDLGDGAGERPVRVTIVRSGGEILLNFPIDEGGARVESPSVSAPSGAESAHLAHPDLGAEWRDRCEWAFLLGADSRGDLHVGIGVAAGEEGGSGDALKIPNSSDARWVRLRAIAHLLSDDEAALATAATALLAWHEQATFCQRCAAPLQPGDGGWTRHCNQCSHIEFPRQDPAVIMAITDDRDRILLAHNVAWRPTFWSLPAGFVDAGESPEMAVVRECQEEVGIKVRDITYWATQPWPFPRSVMLGFTARLDTSGPVDPIPDQIEINDARFYSREEYRAALMSGAIEPPRPTAIAAVMIQQWLGESPEEVAGRSVPPTGVDPRNTLSPQGK